MPFSAADTVGSIPDDTWETYVFVVIIFQPATAVPAVVGTPLSKLCTGNRLVGVLYNAELIATLPVLQIFAVAGDTVGGVAVVITVSDFVPTHPAGSV